MKRDHWGRWLFLLALAAALLPVCAAQDYDDYLEEDSAEVVTPADLTLRFDNDGGAHVDLNLPQKPTSWELIRATLAQAIHCPVSRLAAPASPESDWLTAPAMRHWSVQQRARHIQQVADFNQRRLIAQCPGVLAKHGYELDGTLDYAPLAEELKRTSARQFWLTIEYPASDYFEYSRTSFFGSTQRGKGFLILRAALDSTTKAAPFHLSYGFRRGDLYRAFSIMAGFLLLPFLITLWMRRAALQTAKDDPTAAWFSYFRTLNWCITGAMLLWITSGFGARHSVQNWIHFTGVSGWRLILADVLVLVGPAFLVYLACISISYPIYVQLKGSEWSRGEFLLQQVVTVGATALPLMFFLAALETLGKGSTVPMVLFLLAYLSFMTCRSLKLRLTKAYPQAVTTGELRDRVFALAQGAGVKVGQIFVLPAGKGQVANAYAANTKVVMFTDYLLQHLTKREVDAITAHELSHLRHHHPVKRVLAFYAALFLPTYFNFLVGQLTGLVALPVGLLRLNGGSSLWARVYSVIGSFEQWSQRDFVLIVAGLAVFYFLSRRFEHAADAGAVRLTGDAEAQITGLLKLSRLNLMPIQWGKATESWLTHPSTVRRAERIAAAAGMPAAQLHQILENYQSLEKTRAVKDVPPVEGGPDNYYALPEVSNPDTLRSAARKRRLMQLRLWASLLTHVVPPALVALFAEKWRLEGNPAFAVYVSGAILTVFLCQVVAVRLSVTGRAKQRALLAQRFQREGLPVGDRGDVAMGFAPGAVPRFYGVNHYNWDTGFLVLSKDELVYIGEQTRFALSANQIEGVCLGQGGPSWWKPQRIYIRWRDSAKGQVGAFSFSSLEPCSTWKVRQQVRDLYARLLDWQMHSTTQPARAGLPELQAPSLGEVTSISPRKLGGFKTNLRVLVFLVPLAAAVSVVFRLDSAWYVCGVVLLARLVESIPFWRYRDRPLNFVSPAGEIGQAARAGDR